MRPLLAVRAARMALFRGTANRSLAGLAPHVEHRSPTTKRMDHVHIWVYGNSGATESGLPNSLAQQISDTEDGHGFT
jgi:hypothetical protein